MNNSHRHLKLIKRDEIDFVKWDKCIAGSVNSRHQALSWHLDIVSPGWYGIVYKDYKAVMPLPIISKFGVKIILQPVFCQQLGIFSSERLGNDIIDRFYSFLNVSYPVLYSFNTFNAPEQPVGKYMEELPNIELELNSDYKKLSDQYSKNTKRNIKKAKEENLSVKAVLPDNNLMEQHFQNLRFKFSNKKQRLYSQIIKSANESGILKTYICTYQDKILSTAFFILLKNRLTFIGSSSTTLGYEKAAAFLLFDEVIKTFSAGNLILDFEGSKTPGVARFYKSFGGIEKNYYQISNRAYSVYKTIKSIIQ